MMKKLLPALLTAAILMSGITHSQTTNGTDASPDNMYALLQTANEKDWIKAQNYFSVQKRTTTADSIQAAIKVKFPEGITQRSLQAKTVYDAKTASEKEKAMMIWVKKFPPEKFGADQIQYDYVRNAVGNAYAAENNTAKAIEYANATETPVWKAEGYAIVAATLFKNDHLPEAALLYRKAVDTSYEYVTTRKNEPSAGFPATGYPGYCNLYAAVLLKQQKPGEALVYVQRSHDARKDIRTDVNANYAKILMALGKDKEAFDIIDEAVRAGKANGDMKEDMKSLYKKVRTDNGFDAYMSSLGKQLHDNLVRDLPKQMINLPAPLFTLKDIAGKKVSLADFKGKTVIVDFWATWCGPCKASFPAMQTAVNKYKDNAGVVFLFIHTWEREGENPNRNVKKYLAETNYPFEVLMDLADMNTGINKVVQSYQVSSIPTKFVIDKNGNIRFRLTGFTGDNDAAVEEISAMIELASK